MCITKVRSSQIHRKLRIVISALQLWAWPRHSLSLISALLIVGMAFAAVYLLMASCLVANSMFALERLKKGILKTTTMLAQAKRVSIRRIKPPQLIQTSFLYANRMSTSERKKKAFLRPHLCWCQPTGSIRRIEPFSTYCSGARNLLQAFKKPPGLICQYSKPQLVSECIPQPTRLRKDRRSANRDVELSRKC